MSVDQIKPYWAVEPLPDPSVVPTLSVEEAGRILGIGRSAAYRAVRSGEVPSLWFGRRCRVPTAALAELLGHSRSMSPIAGHCTEISDKTQKSLRQAQTGGAL